MSTNNERKSLTIEMAIPGFDKLIILFYRTPCMLRLAMTFQSQMPLINKHPMFLQQVQSKYEFVMQMHGVYWSNFTICSKNNDCYILFFYIS